MTAIIGIDPGASGAMCVLSGGTVQIIKLDSPGIIAFLKRLAADGSRCFIENISASNKWGKSGIHQMRSISENFGYWCGVLDAVEIQFEKVESKTFELVCGCKLPVYDYARQKEANFQRAKELYPNTQIFKYAADAVLIAYFGTLRT